MREQLRQWLEQKKVSSLDPIATKPSKELLEKLRALGYVK
jgi:hypothetical protein